MCEALVSFKQKITKPIELFIKKKHPKLFPSGRGVGVEAVWEPWPLESKYNIPIEGKPLHEAGR